MVYLVVFAALMFNSLKGYNGKKVSILAKRTEDPYFFSLVRMLMCIVLGLAIALMGGATLRIDGGMLAVCILSGVANVIFLVAWMMSVKYNPMVTVDVTMTTGSIIPAVLCLIFFSEAIRLPKLVGFALIVLASFVLSAHKKSKIKSSIKGLMWLVAVILGDGFIGFSQQLYVKYFTEGGAFAGERTYPLATFHFYTYVVAFIFLAVIFGAMMLRKSGQDRSAYCATLGTALRPALFHIGVMATFLFATTYLQTVATGVMGMPSQMLYPIIKGGSLVVSNVIAALCFGEKPTWRSLVGSLLAIGGIVLMSVL